MTAPSAKPYFRAISGKGSRNDTRQADLIPATKAEKAEVRRALDLYPTGEPDAIRALLARDGDRIRALGQAWEPAAGHGHLSREIEAAGVPCAVSDIADHGCPGVTIRSFYDWQDSPAPVIITNPPYAEINARDGRGKWLRHTLDMPNWRYCAYLLSWDWPAARDNGLGDLLDHTPFSYCYLMRWKLDFTGEGSPTQRNAWFVWDRDWQGAEPAFRWLDKPGAAKDVRQGVLI
jgi:hypothetical protein